VDGKEPGGLRYNAEKPPMHLLPWDALMALAEHYGVGAKKYPARNWEKGLKWNEGCAASLARHLAAWSSGENVDPENGSYHDLAILWNAVALVAFRLRGVGVDDRPREAEPPDRPRRDQQQEEEPLQSELERLRKIEYLGHPPRQD
jgi:hypothetical protein